MRRGRVFICIRVDRREFFDEIYSELQDLTDEYATIVSAEKAER